MEKYQFRSIHFNTDDKTFDILDGSVGFYSYKDIVDVRIVGEDAKYKDKSELFSHQVVVSKYLQPMPFFPKDVYVGIEIIMKEYQKKYVYVSTKASQSNSLDWHNDLEEAKKITELIHKIIKKYNS